MAYLLNDFTGHRINQRLVRIFDTDLFFFRAHSLALVFEGHDLCPETDCMTKVYLIFENLGYCPSVPTVGIAGVRDSSLLAAVPVVVFARFQDLPFSQSVGNVSRTNTGRAYSEDIFHDRRCFFVHKQFALLATVWITAVAVRYSCADTLTLFRF